jgi:hypothetical protein
MIELQGVTWRNYQGALMPVGAPHIRIELSNDEIAHLLKTSGAYFIRWVSDFDCRRETAFWYVIKDGKSSLEALSANTRSKVRRGLKHCSVKKTDAVTIARQGYPVYQKAFSRYDTFLQPAAKENFQKQISNLQDNPEWEFWGVWNKKGDLIAYSQNRIENGTCNYSTIKFDPDYLKLYPSYALFFEMNNHYLNQLGLKYVNDGARSISHNTSIQEFLIDKFKFRKAYCRLNIAYNPKIKMAVRLLYPFRRLLAACNFSVTNKLSVLLKHEEIRRSFELR